LQQSNGACHYFSVVHCNGEARGEARGEAKDTLRLLSRRCGPLSAEQDSVIRSLPLERLEALAEALLDFEGMADLHAWRAGNAWNAAHACG
jgi:Domain of unknown function (DUF4351)